MIDVDWGQFILLIVAMVLGLFGKIIFDWLKRGGVKSSADPETNPLRMKSEVRPKCALDRDKTIFQVKEIHDTVKLIGGSCVKIDSDLQEGIDVAKRNTESYSKFIIAINDLKNMIGNNTKATERLIKENEKQTSLLSAIKKNGH